MSVDAGASRQPAIAPKSNVRVLTKACSHPAYCPAAMWDGTRGCHGPCMFWVIEGSTPGLQWQEDTKAVDPSKTRTADVIDFSVQHHLHHLQPLTKFSNFAAINNQRPVTCLSGGRREARASGPSAAHRTAPMSPPFRLALTNPTCRGDVPGLQITLVSDAEESCSLPEERIVSRLSLPQVGNLHMHKRPFAKGFVQHGAAECKERIRNLLFLAYLE